jgi:hypothetical protein
MYGPAVRCKRTFIELGDVTGAFYAPAIMGISARAISLAVRPQRMLGTQSTANLLSCARWIVPLSSLYDVMLHAARFSRVHRYRPPHRRFGAMHP